ncbi:helicase in vascular tissue and tapetum [Raphanus sativus]|uniref:DExH-box ATP-dependent RNA helicase DExH6 n=1 Tax=Raphanus sativus TaxID=3726 RepID=A0A6J0JWM6_RAPSA|nr:DExH-box ATP-dependent RNA helicase DExH6 [Raphanus sativus]KAJ4891353.1 helicase in vascular tissue and tapetum [Raphanus sativus]
MGKKRFRSENAAGDKKPPSVEATRIWAAKVIDDFRASVNQVYTFEHNLSNSERKVIHQMCRKMGIQSKSSGRGDQRRLSIYKGSHKNGWNKEAKWRSSNREKLRCVSFPPGAHAILQDLFTHYPPCDGDTAAATSFNKYVGRSGKQWRDDFFRKPLFSRDEIVAKVASLSSRLRKDKALQEISKLRSKLPITSFRDAITSAVESNQVILISGETGCGKTTQVPQYLLDHMWSTKRESCKIVCTQPRRISAMSVSERISCERGESIGDNIGYKVRLQSKGGRHSSVVFCTNGILLRVLVGKGSVSYVSDITHIIVDEIHERDCYSDFMLAIIRDLLPSNPHLRLILMSATLDAERFSGYFGGCHVVRVPGFTHPVRTLYLEDVLSILKSGGDNHLSSSNLNIPDQKLDLIDEDKLALDEAITLAWTNDEFDTLLDLVSSQGSPQIYNYQHQSTWLTPLMVFAGKGRISDVCMLLSLGADWKLKSKDGMTASELAEAENHLEAAQIIREHSENSQSNSQQAQQLLDKYMATINPEQVDVSLILQLVRKICGDSEDGGAILVFLPGWDDINKTRQRLLDSPFFADSSKFDIICLHSMVPAGEQKKVFSRPPRGCRKIVLATNIAESAVTIDDVVYVIDSGRMKEKSYDPYSNVSTLQSSWVSKANAKQREGRAGRCQPGICYHLYSRLRAASMPEFKVPEIKRMPVEELCLQVKILDPNCKTNDFLQKLLDPPVDQSIANALSILQDIGALTPEEELTELGEKFGHLPVHPLISKMLFFAVLVNCLDPALTLACAADYKEPFTMPMSPVERQKAAAAKLELASLCGGDSDHLAVVAAFECWKNAKEKGLSAEFCSQYFVSPSAMKMLDQMRSQLESELKRHGVIPSDISSCSQNSRDPGILRAVLAVGLYPMVGRLCPSFGNNRRSLVETASGAKVRVHSLSNNFNLSSRKYDESLVVFDEITRGDGGMHIRNCTVARDLPLLLISTEIAVAPTESGDADDSEEDEDEDEDEETGGVEGDSSNEESRRGEKMMSSPENSVKLVVDRWLPFKTTALEVAQMYILRERLTASILFKVRHPRENLPPHLGASMHAIVCLLSYDGHAGLSSPPESLRSKHSRTEMYETGGCEEKPNSFLNSLFWSLSLKENKPSSKQRNRIRQDGFNTAPTEAASMHRQQNNSQRKPKSANNVDSGKQKEKVFVRQTNVVHQPEAASTTKQLKHKSANSLVSGNKKENESSDQVYGNQQPNTAPREAAVSMAKNQSSKKTKSANNTDPGKKEEKVFVSHTNGIHQPETAYTAKQSKHKSSANSLVLGNKKENKPSDQVCGDQQPNTAPRVAAVLMAKHQSSKKTKTRSDLGKKQGIYVPKIDLHKRQREDKTDLKGTA